MFAATAAASFGSAFIGAQGDVSNYNRQVGAINSEADAVNRSLIFKYQMGQLQQQQIQDRAVIDAGDRRKALLEAKGSAEAGAATAGIEGPSVEALLTSYDVATGSDLSAIYLQRDNEIAQSRAEAKGYQMDAKNRLVSLNNQLPEDPSMKIVGRFLNAAFQTGGAYAQYTTPVKNPDGSTSRRFG